ncbi:MAG: riboflavin synthase [Bacteroidetes bacterium]|nr:riboflavin synthase [Bacteroidota bacterium]
MFTGIIEETGVIQKISRGESSARLQIRARKVLEDLKVGDSINTNGTCLTVTRFDQQSMEVDVMTETMKRTNLRLLQPGSEVNLERALQVNSRLGGHMVSGHIDGTGIITSYRREDIATWVTIHAHHEIMHYIVFKGSVAIDGISLTVAKIAAETFDVSIIPHTSGETTLLRKKVGDEVNIECDIIGKYVEKFLIKQEPSKNKIDYDFLREHGFTD